MIFNTEATNGMSDAQLLDLFLSTGKNDYFGVLYTRYIPLIYGLSLKFLKRNEAAEDAVMQIFEDTLSKIGRFYVREFRTWIYTVTRNHCLQQLRMSRREVRIDEALPFMESDDLVHLFNKYEGEERIEALEKCIEALPDPQKRSIVLFFIEDQSYADIADTTRYSLKSVKSHIQNGKRNLRNCLEKCGVM